MTGSALMVIDLQNDVLGASLDAQGVVGRAVGLIDRARAAGTPVLFVQHQDAWMQPGTAGWEFDAALVPLAGEPVIAKQYWDSFAGTTLADELAAREVDHLVIAGAQTDYCIDHTLQSAVNRGFDVTLVTDTHTTEDAEIGDVTVTAAQIIAHTNAVVASYRVPGRTILALSAAEIVFG